MLHSLAWFYAFFSDLFDSLTKSCPFWYDLTYLFILVFTTGITVQLVLCVNNNTSGQDNLRTQSTYFRSSWSEMSYVSTPLTTFLLAWKVWNYKRTDSQKWDLIFPVLRIPTRSDRQPVTLQNATCKLHPSEQLYAECGGEINGPTI